MRKQAEGNFPKVIPLFKGKNQDLREAGAPGPQASPSGAQEVSKECVHCSKLMFGLARLVPGDVTGSGAGTLHNTGLKFRLRADCSRLEMDLGRMFVCPACLDSRHPLLSRTWLKRQNALAPDNSKFARIVDIDVLMSGWE